MLLFSFEGECRTKKTQEQKCSCTNTRNALYGIQSWSRVKGPWCLCVCVCVIHRSCHFSAVCKPGSPKAKLQIRGKEMEALLCCCLVSHTYKEASRSNLSSCKHLETDTCQSPAGDKAYIHFLLENLDFHFLFFSAFFPPSLYRGWDLA